MLLRRWRSTPFEPVEVVGQRGRQLDDPPLEGATEQVELDLGAGRDVLVPGKDDDATRGHVTLELLHQIGDVDVRLAGHDVVDHHTGAAQKILVSFRHTTKRTILPPTSRRHQRPSRVRSARLRVSTIAATSGWGSPKISSTPCAVRSRATCSHTMLRSSSCGMFSRMPSATGKSIRWSRSAMTSMPSMVTSTPTTSS